MFFFSSRRRHTRLRRDWSSDVCSSDLEVKGGGYRSLVNIGENGGQEVPHLHFHIFGGEKVGKMVS